MKKLIFTEWDGTKYYLNERGDVVDSLGYLLDLEGEQNIRNAAGLPTMGRLEYDIT